jgi:hypothetical protein
MAVTDRPPSNDAQAVPPCPICEGVLKTVYAKFHQIVVVCDD